MNKVLTTDSKDNSLPSASRVELQQLTIKTRFLLHQRLYSREVTLFESELGAESWKWLYPGLRKIADDSLLRPIGSQEVSSLRKGLKLATTLPTWKELIKNSPKEVSTTNVLRFFSSFDLELSKLNKPRTITVLSRKTRSFVLQFIEDQGAVSFREKVSRFYKQPHPNKFPGRKLISDMDWPGRQPLSATSHVGDHDLKSAIKKRLEDDLNSIIDACSNVLDRYENVLLKIEELKNRKISLKRKSNVETLLKKGMRQQKEISVWEKSDILDYLALRVESIFKEPKPKFTRLKSGGIEPPQCPNFVRNLFQGLSNGVHVYQLLRMHFAPPAVVLLACALIIQKTTHWNFISILELEADQIDIKNFPHRIQSVKPRVGDETPIVWIEKTDANVIRAFRILLERRLRLIDAGYISISEKRLWFSSQSIFRNCPIPHVSWGGCLKEFVTHYNFPKFSLEQMRSQCLAAISVGAGGLNHVTLAAGHSDHRTSMHYIDKLLIQRMNDSINLEFERRLESTIRYMVSGSANGEKTIAYPIGDGTLCISPEDPPNKNWLMGDYCTAEHCSDQGGCQNRVLYINEERIEEVVRVKKYFDKHWKELASQNIVRFEKIVLQQMMFNIGLFGVLKRGPFRYLVAKYESIIS